MKTDNKALSYEWFEYVWNKKDDSAVTRLASPRLICHGLSEDPQPTQTVDAFLRFRQGLLSAFPDIFVRVEDVLVDGDKTAIRLTFSGTHTCDGIGIPPTNRRFTATAIVIGIWKDGKVVESWNEFDAAGMMRQLQAPTAQLRP